MKAWKKLLSEKSTLEKKILKREARVYPSDKLHTYISEHPQALLKEIAAHFGGSISGANAALAREKLTLKKRQQRIANVARKNEPNTMKR